jgi:AraC-like DNA-binding protein
MRGQLIGIATSVQPVMPFTWMGQTAVVAARRGIDVESLLINAGIAAGREGIGPDTFLDPAEYNLMCGLLITSIDDEMHGATRSRMRLGTASMGVKLMFTARSLGAAIVTLFRFYDMAGGFCTVRLDQVEGAAIISIHADGEPSSLTHLVEEMMATHLHMLFSYYLGFLLPLDGLRTPARDHPSLGALHPFLRCAIWSGPATELVFSSAYLALPSSPRVSEDALVEANIFWTAQLAKHQGGEAFDETDARVSARVYRALLREDLSFAECCSDLAMGEAEVRHRLFAEGASFRNLRRTALLERVRPHLRASRSTDDIAFSLGYSDARSLRRAIKLAAGVSVSDLRASPTRRPPSADDPVTRNLRRVIAAMA